MIKRLKCLGIRFGVVLLSVANIIGARGAGSRLAEILIVDEATGRGVPLVELSTVNHIKFVTDNAGRIAISEPGLIDEPVFFNVRSHGYEFPKDGFGYRGRAVTPKVGDVATLQLKRINIAERLYRITGEGLYRDSVMLGHETPIVRPLESGKVVGQDSAFAVPYAGKMFWFWGDTLKMDYPLGHFWMAGATSVPPAAGGLNPSMGIDLNYFIDEKGFSRPMCRLGVKTGLIWADGFATVADRDGKERLVCHYAHMESLGKMLGHGLAIYNDDLEEFERIVSLEMGELWRWPTQAHPIHHKFADGDYLLMGDVYPIVRVPSKLDHFANLDSYEAWTCLKLGSTADAPLVDRRDDGEIRWSWRRNGIPVDSKLERSLIEQGLMKPHEARGQTVDASSGKSIQLHRGSVNWNPFRERWIMVFCEVGGTSNLGEIWYAEAPTPTGPWRRATKIITHDQYSFYNPVHHAFLDQENGRFIYLEGTYVNMFSGNPTPTPRYDYNQIMYRLDLDDPRLELARVP